MYNTNQDQMRNKYTWDVFFKNELISFLEYLHQINNHTVSVGADGVRIEKTQIHVEG